MAFLDALTGGAAKTAYKNNMQTINTGLTQQSTALGDNYTQANNYLLGQGLPALGQGYDTARQNLGTGYQDARTDINAGYMTGQDALNANYGKALGSLGQGRDDLNNNYAAGRDALTSNYGQARTDLTNQYAQTQNYLGQATANYQPIISQTANALGQYQNAIGANGQAGSQAAAAAFQAAPGYQYALDQALGSVQRSAAARGGLAGGNATSDILSTANGLASQGYQQYISNLQNSVGINLQGIQGQNAALTNQGNASQSYGNALANVDTSLGNALNGNYMGLGNGLAGLDQASAGIYQNLGNALNTSNVGLGTGLGSLDSGFGSNMANLATSQGSGTLGVYGQAGTNLMNLGNQESNAISNATKMYVDNQNQEAKNQMAASSNLLGTLGGLGQSFIDGGGISGLKKLFSGL